MKKYESGRSMVEMLGVLAIIGVLSVGGIAGYTMAMNKYRANEVAATAAQCAILAIAKAETATNRTLSGVACSDLGASTTFASTMAVSVNNGAATVDTKLAATDAIQKAVVSIGTPNGFTWGTVNVAAGG